MIVRAMTHADIPAGLRLCRASNWNQLEDDWRFFLDHGGARLAVRDGRVVGSVGMAPVRPGLRVALDDAGRSRRTALRHRLAIDGGGARRAGRHARPPRRHSRRRADVPPLRLRRRVSRWRARRSPAGQQRLSPASAPIEPADLPAIFARDREVFGADRSALLPDLYRRAPDLAWIGRRRILLRPPRSLCSRSSVPWWRTRRRGPRAGRSLPRRARGQDLRARRPAAPGRSELRGRAPVPSDVPRRSPAAWPPEQVFAITGPEFG